MRMGAPALSPGDVVHDRYEVLRLLGEGGMGAVYLARHKELEREVALKVLHPHFASDEEVTRRFVREARSAAAIGHPGIVEVFDLGQDDGRVFLAMEKLEGRELADLIAEPSPMPVAVSARILFDIADAVHEAHRKGIVHRDLKPQNVFLARRGRQTDVVKVLDFGIAKLIEAENPDVPLTETGQVFGTPLYMSPEQLRGEKDLDGRADVYALGVILYECLTGRPPFRADSYPELLLKIVSDDPTPVEAVRPDVPEALARLVEDAMAKDRDQRVASAAALMQRLAPFIEGNADFPSSDSEADHLPLAATVRSDYPASAAEGRGQDPSPRRGPLVLGVGATLVLAVVLVWVLAGEEPPTEAPPPAADPPSEAAVPHPETRPREEEPAVNEPLPNGRISRLVHFESEPSNAEVWIEGSRICSTPCAAELGHADARIEVRKEGYVPALRALTVPFPDTVEVTLPSAPERSSRRRASPMRLTIMGEPAAPPPLKTR